MRTAERQKESLIQCTECPKLFNLSLSTSSLFSSFRQHMKVEHSTTVDTYNTFSKCSICQHSYLVRSDLRPHDCNFIFSDSDKMPFQCSECKKLLSCTHALKVHMKRIHPKISISNQPLQMCGSCKKFYFLKHECLTSNVLKEKTVQCTECQTKFQSEKSFRFHLQKQHPEIDVETVEFQCCDRCGMVYPFAPSLDIHRCEVFSSAGETGSLSNVIFSCDLCMEKFDSEFKLRNHIRMHANRDIFLCVLCNQTYSNVGSLPRHMESHIKCKEGRIC